MPYNSWGIAGQPIGGQIQRSRYAPDIQETLARQMLAEGTSTAPVQHWTQGLARLLQGYMGGQIANRAAQEREQRQQGQQQTLAQALAAMQGRPGGIETTPGGTSIDWQAQPGSAKNAAAILAQNPDLAGMGFQLQMSEAEREQARQQRMADYEMQRADKARETEADRAFKRELLGREQAGAKEIARMRVQAQQEQKPLSPTAQKELFEADDLTAASQNAVGLLNDALAVNKDAMYGPFALERAKAATILPGQYPSADATIKLNNIVTGQALESLKAVFGGMPTEGERKILLEMQASAEKTPAQREDILRRAIDMANRRKAFNADKAQKLRSGTYFREAPGVPQSAPAGGGWAIQKVQ